MVKAKPGRSELYNKAYIALKKASNDEDAMINLLILKDCITPLLKDATTERKEMCLETYFMTEGVPQ